ncbi:hypothetical protein I316_01390 [Kwoniella heveanensis BCC8398]|uniref:DUF7729 domain-containing protein n=1 Tax=Kwoniella heveanensis BCC8398 TaxID=1296120 RepID=A0A1B9H0L7_9TREE|nr:hypothetical protein I316_01390 [Kwoniella heveanensis BCC8398]
MLGRTTLVALAASTSYAVAGCTTQIASLALGDLGSCLQLTSLLPILNNGNGSVVGSVNSYLTSLCSSDTPQCSNSTLSSAQSSISSGCSSDISEGGTSGVEVQGLLTLLQNYDHVYAAGCSKNSTTNDFCLTDTLYTIQNTTGTSLTVDYITSLVSGGSSGLSSLESVFQSGGLCTGCVSGIYYEVKQANSSIAGTSLDQTLTQTCGSDFGASAPNTTSSSAASASSGTTSSGSSGAFVVASPFAGLGTAAALGASMVGAAVFGAVAVF